MISIYDAGTVDFNNNGITSLNPSLCEVEEQRNGLYELVLEHPFDNRNKWKNLVEGNIIKAPTPMGNQFFRIYKKNKNMSGIKVNARHIFYDLIDNFIEDSRAANTDGKGVLNIVLTSTQYPHRFTSLSDLPGSKTAHFIEKNPVEAIFSEDGIIDTWGGELERDNFLIKLLQNRGKDRGVTIRYGKNLLGIDEDLSLDSVVTRIKPQGYGGLSLPEKYVDSDLINNYPHPKIRNIEYSDIKVDEKSGITEAMAIAKLRERAQQEFTINKIDIPPANYKVDFLELSKTEEYKNYAVLERVYLCDTVTVKHLKYGFDLKAKVIKYKYDCLSNRYKEIELGSFKDNISNTLNSIRNTVNQILQDAVTGTKMQEAIDHATKLLTGALGGNVVFRPKDKPQEILIMDTEDIMTAKSVWRWNLNGLGHSKSGINGPYETAITMGNSTNGYEGHIVGKFISAHSIMANQLHADVGEKLDLSSNISISAKVSGVKNDLSKSISDAENTAKAYSDNTLSTFISGTYSSAINDIQNRIDGSITTWFYENEPTLTNAPTIDWSTIELKNQHLGDLYYDTVTGYAYRFAVDESVYKWIKITDTDVSKALEDAARAQDTADKKRRVFIEEPIPPYDKGDLWTQGSNGELFRCIISKIVGQSYSSTDWEKASKYTDDTVANGAVNRLDDMVSDNKLTGVEKQTLKKDLDGITAEKVVLNSQADVAKVTAEKTAYDTSYTTLYNYLNPLLADLTTTSDVNGNTLRSCFSDYYSKKATLLRKIADNSIDNINIGGRNLFLNSNFEKRTSPREYMLFSDVHYILKEYVGKKLTFSFDIKADIPGNVLFYSTNKARYRIPSTNIEVTTEYQRKSFNLLISDTNNGLTESWLEFYGTYDTERFITVKNMKIETGNKASDWSPAPEDVDKAIKDAKDLADAAQGTADAAKQNAETANTALTNMSSDNKITPVEKISIKKEFDIIVSEKVKIDSSATTYGIDKTTYGTAYTALYNYVDLLLTDMSTTQDLTKEGADSTGGVTFRRKFKTYYDARQDLLNAISAKAKSIADNAQSTANSKSRTFISQPIPPYSVGDMWIDKSLAPNGFIKVCILSRATGSYVASDWVEDGLTQRVKSAEQQITADAITSKFVESINGGKVIETGIIKHSKDGIEVIHSTANTKTIMNAHGFSIINTNTEETIGQFTQSDGQAGFTTVLCNEVIANNIMTYQKQDATYYVNGSTGNDITGDGSNSKPFKTLFTALSKINKIFDEYYRTVKIYVYGNCTEDVTIENFTGTPGLVTTSWSGNPGIYISMDRNVIFNGTIRINNCSIPILISGNRTHYTDSGGALIKQNRNGTNIIQILNSKSVVVVNIRIQGLRKGDNNCGFYVGNSNAIIRTIDACDLGFGILAANFSQVMVYDLVGSRIAYGIYSMDHANIRIMNSASLFRADTGTYISDGAIIVPASYNFLESYFNPSAAPPPPTTQNHTTRWDTNQTKSWRDNWGWRSDNRYIYQGQYGSNGVHRGFMYFDSASIRGALSGATINNVYLYLARRSSGGSSAATRIRLYGHQYDSPSGGTGLYVDYGYIGSWAWGESKWISLPSNVGEGLKNGSIKGLALYDGSSNYAIFEAYAKLEINYTK
ncbi:phage minor structural protein, N-terminal region [Clostridium amylolyticum]|uniref:Phage minor structural protein, N-terminal region n=1 Tax=Clostridium amylolyticum TaxID=1121298 RepID=A0A1M6EV50_9CLOT|nr:phage tail spike protein [Clostridium amylolyticum]SHI89210.1 phage minor structural protein, N-terminal region [Clostridium amylolyticum]